MGTLRRAFEYYVKVGYIDQAVAVAEHPIPPAAGITTGMAELISGALRLVPRESVAMGRLLSLQGRLEALEEGDYSRAQETLGHAIEIARREGDAGLESRALADAAEAALYGAQYADALAYGLRGSELAARIDDPRAETLGHDFAALSSVVMGNLDRAAHHVAASLVAAERLRHSFYLGRALYANGLVARCRGDWETARSFDDRGLTTSPQDPRLLMNRVLEEAEMGNFTAAASYLDKLLEVTRLTPPGPTLYHLYAALASPLFARISGDESRLDVAEEAITAILASPSSPALISDFATVGLALLAVLRNDPEAAKLHYGRVKPATATVALGMGGHRLLGLLAQTMGRLDQAATRFEDALSFCREGGYRPELAWTCCDYAGALLQRNAAGDRTKAMSLLDESLAISWELGMRPLMERALFRREILKA